MFDKIKSKTPEREISEDVFDTIFEFEYQRQYYSKDIIEVYRCSPPPYSKEEPNPRVAENGIPLAYQLTWEPEEWSAILQRNDGSHAAKVNFKTPILSMTAANGSDVEKVDFTRTKHAFSFETSADKYAWVDQSKDNRTIILLKNPAFTRTGAKDGTVVGKLEVTCEGGNKVRLEVDDREVSEAMALGSVIAHLRSLETKGNGKSLLVGFGAYSALEITASGAFLAGAGLLSVLT